MAGALLAGETPRLVTSTLITPRNVVERRVLETVVTPRVVKPLGAETKTPGTTAGDRTVEQIAAEHALSADLVRSIIKVESNYNPKAISPKGARGLMQLVPSTARRFGVSNAFDAVDNVEGGARYLRYLLNLYDGNYPLTLAAYNAGERAVARYGGVPPYRETQNYVVQVWRELQRTKRAAALQKEGAPK